MMKCAMCGLEIVEPCEIESTPEKHLGDEPHEIGGIRKKSIGDALRLIRHDIQKSRYGSAAGRVNDMLIMLGIERADL